MLGWRAAPAGCCESGRTEVTLSGDECALREDGDNGAGGEGGGEGGSEGGLHARLMPGCWRAALMPGKLKRKRRSDIFELSNSFAVMSVAVGSES